MKGRVMGLDVGDRRIGIALSDPLQIFAQAHSTLQRQSLSQDLEALASLAREQEVERIILGLPLMMSGREGPQSHKTRRFAAALAQQLPLPQEFWDERLSSRAAELALREGGVRGRRQRQAVDKVAAALILQGWLETQSGLS